MARTRTWTPLTNEHKNDLVELVLYGQQLARKSPSMSRLAVYLIKVAGWRWTADAVDAASGIVIPDAIKYDVRYLPHTVNAAQVTTQYPGEISKRLTHEHTVPLGLLAEWVLKLPGDAAEIRRLFDNYCRAAILTREEDQKLNSAKLRSAMPLSWRFGDSAEARYKTVGVELIIPSELNNFRS